MAKNESTAFEIIKQASIRLGFPAPNSITDESDTNTQRLLGQLNATLEETLRDYDWQQLIRECKFTTDPNSPSNVGYDSWVKGYSLKVVAPGFDYFITSYVYNCTQRRMINSVTYDRFEFDKFYSGSIFNKFIVREGHICFLPELSYGQEMSFFYKSKYAVINHSDPLRPEPAQYFTQDSDESLIDDKLLIRGLIWKYKSEMGSNYAENYRDYQNYLTKLKDQDSNRRNIGAYNKNLPGVPIAVIPDTGVGL